MTNSKKLNLTPSPALKRERERSFFPKGLREV